MTLYDAYDTDASIIEFLSLLMLATDVKLLGVLKISIIPHNKHRVVFIKLFFKILLSVTVQNTTDIYCWFLLEIITTG